MLPVPNPIVLDAGKDKVRVSVDGEPDPPSPPWYKDGIRFECVRCGNCCSGPPGRVWFQPDELAAMAEYLGLLPFQFQERYARRLDGRPSLAEVS